MLSLVKELLGFSTGIGSDLLSGVNLGVTLSTVGVSEIVAVAVSDIMGGGGVNVTVLLAVTMTVLVAVTVLEVSGISNIGAGVNNLLTTVMSVLVNVLVCMSKISFLVGSSGICSSCTSGVDNTLGVVSSGVGLSDATSMTNTTLTTFQVGLKFEITSESFLVLELIDLGLTGNLQESLD